MFQPDPNQRPMGISHSILPPHFIGGISRSRHDVALAYVEKQPAHRAAMAANQAKPKTTWRLWSILSQAARHVAGHAWRPKHGRFKLHHLRGALK